MTRSKDMTSPGRKRELFTGLILDNEHEGIRIALEEAIGAEEVLDARKAHLDNGSQLTTKHLCMMATVTQLDEICVRFRLTQR